MFYGMDNTYRISGVKAIAVQGGTKAYNQSSVTHPNTDSNKFSSTFEFSF